VAVVAERKHPQQYLSPLRALSNPHTKMAFSERSIKSMATEEAQLYPLTAELQAAHSP